ncbi:MAG TPA: Gfo/Idh/MocA family oxidoreductase [Patescibacteria group bacterium]|nr:Gfo/Idh/MocA family oxidoreductase [Patescibacteria group bacterium]
MERIRWGMIGTGSVARHKSGPAFMRVAGSTLAGVASRTPASAEAYARDFGVARVFADPQALIVANDIDAVYIATPPSSHVPLALEVAKAGKPCCIEKPMAVHYPDAVRVQQAFVQAGQPLFVSYYRRSLPRFLQVRDWIRDGAIGEVRGVDWRLARVAPADPLQQGWRTSPGEAIGGLFDDLACHGLDLFDFLFGPMSAIVPTALARDDATRVLQSVGASWRHGSRVTGRGTWDFAAAARVDAVTVTGSDGTIRFSMFDEQPIVLQAGTRHESRVIAHPQPIQLPHVAAMVSHLAGTALHPSMAESALRTAWATARILGEVGG